MIAYIQGTLTEKQLTRAVLDVQGVGYEILIPVSSYEKLGALGDSAKLLTYLHVREDLQQLFGFATQEERELFLLLISVSGIGPKSGLGILSSIAIADFKQAIVRENFDLLTAVPGIGKKTAQRIVVELKDKISKLAGSEEVSTAVLSSKDHMADEAMMALISLGYAKAAAEKAIVKALREQPDQAATLQELIKTALRFATSG